MGARNTTGLTQDELVDIDRSLQKLSAVNEDTQKLHNTGIIDLTEDLVGQEQMRNALTALKQEFAPTGPQVP